MACASLHSSLSLSFPQKQPQKIFVGMAKASVPTRLTQRGCQEPTDLSAPGTCEPELLRMLACPPPEAPAPLRSPAQSWSPEEDFHGHTVPPGPS